jgi:ring-1,2-phenylacetyl-CoA epoxidase subunit PaaE
MKLPNQKVTYLLNQMPKCQKNYAAFVAGSGITPVLHRYSIGLENEPNSTFVLVYEINSRKP